MVPLPIGIPIVFPLACSFLKWWLECVPSLRPAPLASFSPPDRMETDTSEVGWGDYAHSNSCTQGKRSFIEANISHSSRTWTVLLGRKSLCDTSPFSLLFLCDNLSAAYLNRLVGIYLTPFVLA